MEIGMINKDNLEVFQTLLLPEEAESLRSGKELLALGIVEEGTACGAVSGWLKEGWFEIRSFYVAPAYRRKGGGRLMLESLCRLLKGRTGTLEISYTRTREEHETLGAFLKAFGFEKEDDRGETLYRILLGDVFQTSFFSGDFQPPQDVKAFSELSEWTLKQAYKKQLALGTDYMSKPLTDASLDGRMSMAIVRDNEIQAFVAFDRSCAGQLTLAWVQGGSDPNMLPVLFRSACAKAGELYGPEELLCVQAVNQASASLIQTLLPGAEAFSETYTYTFQR